MTPEQQQLAIAEACGEDNDSIYRDLIPDYLNDLNAMHEAEELFYAKSDTLEGAERMRDYSRWLCNIAKYPLRAKAAQRAEAFLRTIGKWEECK